MVLRPTQHPVSSSRKRDSRLCMIMLFIPNSSEQLSTGTKSMRAGKVATLRFRAQMASVAYVSSRAARRLRASGGVPSNQTTGSQRKFTMMTAG